MKKSVLAALIGFTVCGGGIWALGNAETLFFYTLKGPSAIGAVQMFKTPPADVGIKFSIQALSGADVMISKLLTGEAKIGTLPPNIAAKLAAAGRPLQIAAVVGYGMLRLLSSDPSIKTIDDLRGRAIEVAGQGATPEYVLRRILRAHELNPDKDLRLGFSLPYVESALAIAAGRIQLALLPEPFATMALAANPDLCTVSDIQAEWAAATSGENFPMTVIVVDRDFASSKPDAVQRFLEAYRSSLEWTIAYPHEAGILAERFELGMTAAVAERAIPSSAYEFRTAIEAKTALSTLYKVFLEFAPTAIGGKLPTDDLYLTP